MALSFPMKFSLIPPSPICTSVCGVIFLFFFYSTIAIMNLRSSHIFFSRSFFESIAHLIAGEVGSLQFNFQTDGHPFFICELAITSNPPSHPLIFSHSSHWPHRNIIPQCAGWITFNYKFERNQRPT